MELAFFSCLTAYFLGSIPNGLWLGKLIWHVDLREHGSHNIGATNAWRTLGKGPGLLIFLLDFFKGALSVWVACAMAGTPLVMVLAGVFAILGHSCSIFLKFKGGKGVATGLGVIVMLMPLTALFVFLVWLVLVNGRAMCLWHRLPPRHWFRFWRALADIRLNTLHLAQWLHVLSSSVIMRTSIVC